LPTGDDRDLARQRLVFSHADLLHPFIRRSVPRATVRVKRRRLDKNMD
jgi:hypothetical protein